MAPIPTPVQSYACAVLNNKIYIIGGAQMPKSENWSEGLKASNLVQIFDTQTNQWTAGTPLPFGVTGAEGCAKLGINATKLIYVMGGYSSIRLMGTLSKPPNPTLLNQVYNPVTGVWSLEGSVPDIQWSFSLVNINDVFYAVGGYDKGSITLNNGQTTGGQTTQRYIPLGYASNAYPSSTSTVPEFSYLTILPILLAITIILAIVRKRFQENV
jgi:N-acetylneuraminic acid mutarotase